MKERPILFSAPMVRAILEGRKTKTRRKVKRNAAGRVELAGKQWHIEDENAVLACPYGQVGSHLWVKETFKPNCYVSHEYIYRATETDPLRYTGPWKPSIFMPRWASRINLGIVDVRIERLQDISDADVEAEGTPFLPGHEQDGGGFPAVSRWWQYQHLWESINGKGSWATNPFVWVIEFRKI